MRRTSLRRRPRLSSALGVVLLTLVTLTAVVAADPAPASAAPPATNLFEKVKLDGGTSMGEPIELAVAPDQKVFYINRGTSSGGGQVRLYNPTTRTTTVALSIALDARFEDGLIGITLDPGFATNRWLYLFYSPAQATLVNRISRFTFNADDERDRPGLRGHDHRVAHRAAAVLSLGRLDDLGHRRQPVLRGRRQHQLRRRLGRHGADRRAHEPGRRSTTPSAPSGNTNDLRGKINRIKPTTTGTYTIPAGNLFAPGTANTRPEIYIMGDRNPYRIWVDKKANNTLYWGEVGPDAGATIANRGPAAYDEFNRATGPGNYGWPYCGGPNVAYNDWDFAANAPRGWFPCGGTTGPVNNSPRNTGLQQLAADQAGAGVGAARRQPGVAGPGQPGRLRLARTTPRSTTTTRTWSRT